jgi:ankyrin repeat protein
VNAVDEMGNTPLHTADVEKARVLIGAKANVNVPDINGVYCFTLF